MIPAGIGVFDGGMVGLFVLYDLDYDIAVTVTILTRLMGIGLFSANRDDFFTFSIKRKINLRFILRWKKVVK